MAHRPAKLAALFALSFAACAWAQEKSAPAAGIEAKTIEEAKRDFQALKASRAGPEQRTNALALPKVELPSLTTEAITPTSQSRNAKREKRAQQKSKNWLLEAMAQTEKTSGNSSAQERTRGSRNSGGSATVTTFSDELDAGDDENPLSPTAGLDEPAAVRNEQPIPATKDTVVLDNPLTPFMSDWISQRDHEVLLPKTSATPMLDASLAQLVDSPGASPAPSVGGPASAALPGLAPALDAGTRGFTENPYLKVDWPMPASAPALLPPPVALPAAAMLPPETKSSMSEPVAPSKAAPPPADLRQPPPNEKYFPQLKRF